MMPCSIPVFIPRPEQNREPTEGEQNRKGTRQKEGYPTIRVEISKSPRIMNVR